MATTITASVPAVRTRITSLFGCKYPIVLPGMSWISSPTLVAAASNAGETVIIMRMCKKWHLYYWQSLMILHTDSHKNRRSWDTRHGTIDRRRNTASHTYHPFPNRSTFWYWSNPLNARFQRKRRGGHCRASSNSEH